MFYRKEKNEYGDYVAEDTRYDLWTGSYIDVPKGKTPEDYGWYEFPTEEACLEAWGLEASTKFEVRSTKFEECAPNGAED